VIRLLILVDCCHGRPQKFFQGGATSTFAYPFLVADDAMKMDVHKRLCPFYTVEKITRQNTHSIRILFEIVFRWRQGCQLFQIAIKDTKNQPVPVEEQDWMNEQRVFYLTKGKYSIRVGVDNT